MNRSNYIIWDTTDILYSLYIQPSVAEVFKVKTYVYLHGLLHNFNKNIFDQSKVIELTQRD